MNVIKGFLMFMLIIIPVAIISSYLASLSSDDKITRIITSYEQLLEQQKEEIRKLRKNQKPSNIDTIKVFCEKKKMYRYITRELSYDDRFGEVYNYRFLYFKPK